MKKFFTKILISAVMVAIFLAPVSPSFQKNSEGDLALVPKVNVALADAALSISQAAIVDTDASFAVKIESYDNGYNTYINSGLFAINTDGTTGSEFGTVTQIPINTTHDGAQIYYSGLTPNTTYRLIFGLTKVSTSWGFTVGVNATSSVYKVDFKTRSTSTGIHDETMNGQPLSYNSTTNVSNNNQGTTANFPTSDTFGCDITKISTWFQQCIVGAVFHLIWEPIAKVTIWVAAILDFFVYYSTNSSSYSGSFIGSAWASVRDIANIFFIIALLYVAIQTILGMEHHGKKMIATIVVVALLINFSLFFTEVIIDASNILAKVFYNHIDAKGPNGEVVGLNGQKSITVSLVSTFNPQLITANKAATEPGLTFVTILISIALMISMIFIFLSIALLFVGRVAGLWIAMIFAPIAFASYTLPLDIPGFGHKEWWSNLLKQSFMAPIFIFFLYIILLLGSSFKLIPFDVYSSDTMLNSIMRVVVPFMLIFILLREAKKMAVKYSGEMGEAFTKVGGFAMGAVGGLAAFGLTAGVGSLAAKAAGSTGLQEAAEKKGLAGFGARMALRTADYGTKATFDIRKSPIGTMMAKQGIDLKSGTGVLGLGENVTTGGYKGVVARKQEKIEKGAELFKTKMSDTEVKTWSTDRATKKYEADKTIEQIRLGASFDQAEFDKTHSNKPEFTTAKQLNESRLKTYKDNIGKTGLIYSAAASMTTKATQ